ncbi:hypothetical protein SAMN05192559_101980 [Halobacillus karajensis]|uniref:Uncharacterized protein n=1 Tax=Halobacillus karajensis TaxID=195088 RepID=A0A059NZC6_9BACI|nr:hypothetical protein [Halobacillus karajensis]CDQ18406.1 hypothetical protein BN982_00676 [Halobacillus karajensis]CDQ23522.1 hypothetical protein BN983_01752 [Halobacillus karajensis]CDQ27004.1 hypothetical protein BN981_01232 [Halobacillus karajensis]SEH51825.1 hypothetical protein SAMN05192559_101980 [Halobacillus karajensis]
MAFTTFLFSAWLIISLFIILPKRLNLIENSFIFLTIGVISINWSWIIYEELKFGKITENPADYAGFLIFRSIIIPTLIMFQLNRYGSSSFNKKMTFVISISTIGLILLTLLSRVFDVTTYKQWHLIFDVLYYLGLHIIALVVLICLRKAPSSEVKQI